MTNRGLPLVMAGALVLCAGCNREEAAPPSAATNTTTPATAAQSAEETTDAGITTAVQARFYGDDQVHGRNVSVAAENGVGPCPRSAKMLM